MVLALFESAVDDVLAKTGDGGRAAPAMLSADAGDRRAHEGRSLVETLTESVLRIFADWGEGMRY